VTGNTEINISAYSDALVLLGTAAVLIPLFRRRGVNQVLGYLAAGALLGPFGLGSFVGKFHPLYWITIADPVGVSGIAELGIVFLLFVIGLELSLPRLKRMRRMIAGLGGLQVVLSAAIITFAALAMGQGLPAAIVLGASLALSSTAIVLEILTRQNRMQTDAGRAAFAVLLAQDMAAIPILMFVSMSGVGSAAASGGTVAQGLLKALLQAAIAVGVIVFAGRHLMRPLFRLVATAHSTELFIAAVLLVVIGTGVVAHQAGLSMALGAFIAGLLLADTEFRKAIQATIDPAKGLLLGVFFFTVGMRVDFRALVREPWLLLTYVVGLIAIKAFVLTGLARLFRLPWAAAIETGLLLGPGGEFAFVVLGMAADLHLMSAQTSGMALAVVSVTMATTPALSTIAGRLERRFREHDAVHPELLVRPAGQTGHAIVVGYGRVGKVVCELLGRASVPFLAVDFDPEAVIADRRQGHEVFFGDASDRAFLRSCGVDNALGVIITMSAGKAVDGIVAHVRSMRPEVPIIARARDASHARHLYAIGASEAVPETIEASLQLSEAALLVLGVAAYPAMTAVNEARIAFQRRLHEPETPTD
jgi:monovalent cation:H+ antiporter-2, CPA2 family